MRESGPSKMMLAYTVLLCVIAYSQSFTSVSKVGFLRVNKLFARSSGRSGETEKGMNIHIYIYNIIYIVYIYEVFACISSCHTIPKISVRVRLYSIILTSFVFTSLYFTLLHVISLNSMYSALRLLHITQLSFHFVGSIRQARVARAIRDELTEIICDVDIKATNYPSESLLRSVSITDVDVSHDLLFAKAYITVLGNSVEKRQIFVWLSENVGQIRYSLAKRMRSMRRVPDISFKLSDTKNMMDLVNLIEEVVPQTVASDDDVEFEEDDEEE